jgi:hypothetical protein
LRQPVDLLIQYTKWAAILARIASQTSRLIWSNNSMSQVGFGIELYEMGHAIVE